MPQEIKPYERDANSVRDQVNRIQALMKNVMQPDQHYGVIPGCGAKPTLLQPGAEKIAMMFGWTATYDVERHEEDGGHREYDVTCTLTNRQTGELMGMGVGLCSTMESKYRYRKGDGFEPTGQPIPRDARERKADYRRQGLGMKKVDGEWLWVRFSDERVENPDIADTYNTVLKMAKKRAFVDAVKSTAAASDVFTQDIEELPQYEMPVEAVVEHVEPKTDVLAEVRARFTSFKSATGLDNDEAMAEICAACGADSMPSMTAEQAAQAVAYMDETINAPVYSHDLDF